MYDAVPHTRPLMVTGSLGSAVPLEGQSVPIQTTQNTYQGPTTILNVVSDAASQRGIDTMNIMVHLPQYLQLEEDYAGTARMLEVLSAFYDIPPELLPKQRGERQYHEFSEAAERNSELKALISRLETYYDSQTTTEGQAPPLSPEIERFLENLDHGLDEPQS